MNNKNIIVAIAVVLIAGMFLGEIAIYVKNPYSYSADIAWNDDGLGYTITSSNNVVYDLTLIDNEDSVPINELIICSDGSEYFDRINSELAVRNFTNVTFIDSENIADLMHEPEGKAILIPRGMFPEEIYSGNSMDPMMEWFDGGGAVFWFGCAPNDEYANTGYLELLGLSKEDFCIRENHSSTPSGMLCKPLSLRNNLVYNGIRADAGTPLAYVSDDGYSSITSIKVSNGSLVVLGGGHTYENSMDCAQLISAGITADSRLLEHRSGTVKGTIERFVELENATEMASMNISVYIYVGGYYIVYGKGF